MLLPLLLRQRTLLYRSVSVLPTATRRALVRGFSSSSSSTTTDTHETLDRATFFVVDPLKNPLGTMDRRSWDDVGTILSGWLEPQPPDQLTGYRVDSAERILQRLLYETATTRPNSLLRQERERRVAEWQDEVLRAWLHVATLTTTKPSSGRLVVVVAQRAELALERIVESYNQGRRRQSSLPVQSFVQLVQLWSQIILLTVVDSTMAQVEGFQHAAELLLAWTDDDTTIVLLEEYKAELSHCFNTAMRQAIQILQGGDDAPVGEDFVQLATKLAGRMEALKESSGWNELEDVRQMLLKESQ